MADLQLSSEPPTNGVALPPETLAAGLGAKRQRRPSVRLGDIGEQPAAIPYEPYVRRSKQWRISSHHPYPHPNAHGHHHPPKESAAAAGGGIGKIPSRTRPLTNLVSDDGHDALEIPVIAEDKSLHLGDENMEPTMGIRRGSRDGKPRRGGGPARRVRTNWISKVDDGMEGADLKSSGGEDVGDDGYRDYDDMHREDAESPLKDHSPSERRTARLRVSESRDVGPATAVDMVEVDAPSETDGREWNNGRCQSFEDGGVRAWLNGLGLGRYAPVFEIHEVDDDVLPLLTLEDLKDMGVNAVGSRRKMYCAIQKLGKGFS